MNTNVIAVSKSLYAILDTQQNALVFFYSYDLPCWLSLFSDNCISKSISPETSLFSFSMLLLQLILNLTSNSAFSFNHNCFSAKSTIVFFKSSIFCRCSDLPILILRFIKTVAIKTDISKRNINRYIILFSAADEQVQNCFNQSCTAIRKSTDFCFEYEKYPAFKNFNKSESFLVKIWYWLVLIYLKCQSWFLFFISKFYNLKGLNLNNLRLQPEGRIQNKMRTLSRVQYHYNYLTNPIIFTKHFIEINKPMKTKSLFLFIVVLISFMSFELKSKEN